MGGCASKPKDFDTANKESSPVEAPPSPIAGTPEKAEAEAVASQEIKDEEETKVVALVEASEPAAVDEPKEAIAETKPEAVQVDKLNEAKAEAEETPKEEKKEVAETVATTA